MSEVVQPTQETLYEALEIGAEDMEPGDDLYCVDERSTGQWRWGVVKTAIFKRVSDQTLWRAQYQVATGDNSDTHGLREGHATVDRVYPHKITITEYRTKPQETTP